MDKFKTVQVFDTPINAHLLLNHLEVNGIDGFLVDEHTVGVNPLYNYAVGGVKVKVAEEDYSRAKSLIVQLENSKLKDDNGKEIQCPRCHSTNLYYHFPTVNSLRAAVAFVFAILFTVLPLYIRKINRCKDCEHEFKHKEL